MDLVHDASISLRIGNQVVKEGGDESRYGVNTGRCKCNNLCFQVFFRELRSMSISGGCNSGNIVI